MTSIDYGRLLREATDAVAQAQARIRTLERQHREPIAVIGMGCRFPEAENTDAFWRNLKEGRESLRTFTEEELAAGGVPEAL